MTRACLALLLLGGLSWGQNKIAVTAAVRGVSDPLGMATIDLTVQNNSGKTITAWAWSVEGQYVDGSTRSRSRVVDGVTDLLAPDGKVFAPGSRRAFEDMLPLGPNRDLPVHVTATLTMVAFADDTALGKQPFNLQGLLADLPLQFGLLCVIPAPLSEARKGVARPLAELAPPAAQDVGVNFKGPCDLGNRGTRFQPLDGGQFHFTRKRSSRQSHDTILHLMKSVS